MLWSSEILEIIGGGEVLEINWLVVEDFIIERRLERCSSELEMVPKSERGRTSSSLKTTSRGTISFCRVGSHSRYIWFPIYPRRQHLTERGSSLAPSVIIFVGIR